MKNKNIAHILVPLDFSGSSLNALETALAIAKQHNTTITLLNVKDPGFMFGFKGVYYISEKAIDSIVLETFVRKKVSKQFNRCNTIIRANVIFREGENGNFKIKQCEIDDSRL